MTISVEPIISNQHGVFPAVSVCLLQLQANARKEMAQNAVRKYYTEHNIKVPRE